MNTKRDGHIDGTREYSSTGEEKDEMGWLSLPRCVCVWGGALGRCGGSLFALWVLHRAQQKGECAAGAQ